MDKWDTFAIARDNTGKSHLNGEWLLLGQISAETGGSYYLSPRRHGEHDGCALYQRQSRAPLPRKSEAKEQWVRRPHERYQWPLAIGILLLIAEIFFPERQPPVRRDSTKSSPLQPPAMSARTLAIPLLIRLSCCYRPLPTALPQRQCAINKAGKFPECAQRIRGDWRSWTKKATRDLFLTQVMRRIGPRIMMTRSNSSRPLWHHRM